LIDQFDVETVASLSANKARTPFTLPCVPLNPPIIILLVNPTLDSTELLAIFGAVVRPEKSIVFEYEVIELELP
jgi:hypothetical protein